jgi:hypothetical protein
MRGISLSAMQLLAYKEEYCAMSQLWVQDSSFVLNYLILFVSVWALCCSLFIISVLSLAKSELLAQFN